MIDDPVSNEVPAKWVSLYEGARIIARLDGEPLRHPNDAPRKALINLVEKLRQGLVNSCGERFSLDSELGNAIIPDDWDKCALALNHPTLREPGNRHPRFIDIEVDANWCNAAIRARRGRAAASRRDRD